MQITDRKCVMVIDEALPLGIIANTAAILGTTLGKKQPDLVGADVVDKSGNEHLGIALCGSKSFLPTLWEGYYRVDCQPFFV